MNRVIRRNMSRNTRRTTHGRRQNSGCRCLPPEGAGGQNLEGEHPGVVMPFQFRTAHGLLSFISTTTIFGTPVDVTLQELALETFFPADDFTREVLRQLPLP